MKHKGGLMFEKTTALTEWITVYDAQGKVLGHVSTKGVSDFFRTNSDRSRNRSAFGFIALGYSVQILGLVLGMQA